MTLEKLVSKFWVTVSTCSINKGDIIEVRVYEGISQPSNIERKLDDLPCRSGGGQTDPYTSSLVDDCNPASSQAMLAFVDNRLKNTLLITLQVFFFYLLE